MAETRRFSGLGSRSQLKAANNLGIISKPLSTDVRKYFRRPDLDLLDAYFEGRQYSHLPPWDQSMSADSEYVPVRKRQPLLQFNLANAMMARLASKLVGRKNFPKFTIEEDPDTEEFLRFVIKAAKLEAKLVEPIKRELVTGSVFVRFAIVDGAYKVEHYLSKWCFPEFLPNGQLKFIKVQYVFDDYEDLDEQKQPKKKWYRIDLGALKDIKYKETEFKKDGEPEFEVEQVVEHKLGFVQGEWFRTSVENNNIDGMSVLADSLGFIDELNYNMSQSSTAISYNQDPQMTLSNMDEDDVEKLIRSSQKAWNLGKEGQAEFLESTLNGVASAMEFRDKMRLAIQDVSRVVLLDPEKAVAHSQSGRAMEILHAPMLELIYELQPQVEENIKNLLLKIALATLIQNERGAQVPVTIPEGFKVQSLNVSVSWPDVFPKTMQDLQSKVSVASTASSANLISRETLTRWLAEEFDVQNVEEEVAKVNAQPVINPFGGF